MIKWIDEFQPESKEELNKLREEWRKKHGVKQEKDQDDKAKKESEKSNSNCERKE